MIKSWVKYKKVLDKLSTAKKDVRYEFNKLFKVGSILYYRRQEGGKIHAGKIIATSTHTLRLRVINLNTLKMYWVEAFWFVEKKDG